VPSIRRAVQADGPEILNLIRELADYEKLSPPDDDAAARLLTDAFGAVPRFEIFLAIEGETVAGYAFIFETYSTFLALPTLYIEDIFVREAYRKHGIGKALFQHCVAEAHARGCGRLDWVVLDWNQSAIEFYQRQGGKYLAEWQLYRITREEIAALIEG